MTTRPINSKFICVQSSVTPAEWKQATYNDLACLHAGHSKDSFLRRMMAMAREIRTC